MPIKKILFVVVISLIHTNAIADYSPPKLKKLIDKQKHQKAYKYCREASESKTSRDETFECKMLFLLYVHSDKKVYNEYLEYFLPCNYAHHPIDIEKKANFVIPTDFAYQLSYDCIRNYIYKDATRVKFLMKYMPIINDLNVYFKKHGQLGRVDSLSALANKFVMNNKVDFQTVYNSKDALGEYYDIAFIRSCKISLSDIVDPFPKIDYKALVHIDKILREYNRIDVIVDKTKEIIGVNKYLEENRVWALVNILENYAVDIKSLSNYCDSLIYSFYLNRFVDALETFNNLNSQISLCGSNRFKDRSEIKISELLNTERVKCNLGRTINSDSLHNSTLNLRKLTDDILEHAANKFIIKSTVDSIYKEISLKSKHRPYKKDNSENFRKVLIAWSWIAMVENDLLYTRLLDIYNRED